MTHLRQREESGPTEARRAPGADGDTGMERTSAAAAGPRRWVVALGIALAIAAVLLVFVLHLTGVLGPGAH